MPDAKICLAVISKLMIIKKEKKKIYTSKYKNLITLIKHCYTPLPVLPSVPVIPEDWILILFASAFWIMQKYGCLNSERCSKYGLPDQQVVNLNLFPRPSAGVRRRPGFCLFQWTKWIASLAALILVNVLKQPLASFFFRLFVSILTCRYVKV